MTFSNHAGHTKRKRMIFFAIFPVCTVVSRFTHLTSAQNQRIVPSLVDL